MLAYASQVLAPVQYRISSSINVNRRLTSLPDVLVGFVLMR